MRIPDDRGPLTHDFDILDLHVVEAVELCVGDRGQVWFNVNGKCLFRAGVVNRVEINDDRNSKRKKRKS